MTIVIAKKDREVAWLLADTMISDASAAQQNAIPGRLKAIVLSHELSVAYAGDANPAWGDIIACHRMLIEGCSTSEVIEFLRRGSIRTLDRDVSYLVVSHSPSCRIVRLQNGGMLEVDDAAYIGNEGHLDALAKNAHNVSASDLRTRFIDAFLKNPSNDYIGGFPISLRAEPSGHRYVHHGGVYIFRFDNWEEVTPNEFHEPVDNVETGDGHYRHHIAVTSTTGVPVVGALLPQAAKMYVYSPLEARDPFGYQLGDLKSTLEERERTTEGAATEIIQRHVDAVLGLRSAKSQG